MEKVFHFDSPSGHYRADACVISCYDARFDLVVRKFLKRSGVAVYDHVKIPGSAKALAATDSDVTRDFVLEMVRISMRLHHAPRLLLIGHNQCGAYGGAGADIIVPDLFRAALVVSTAEPSLAIECYFADFDGIYRCGPPAAGKMSA